MMKRLINNQLAVNQWESSPADGETHQEKVGVCVCAEQKIDSLWETSLEADPTARGKEREGERDEGNIPRTG